MWPRSLPLPEPLQLFFLCRRLWLQDANVGQRDRDHPPSRILFLLLLLPAPSSQVFINPRTVPQSSQCSQFLQSGGVSFPFTSMENTLWEPSRTGTKLPVRLLHDPCPVSAFPHCGLPPAHPTPVWIHCALYKCVWYPEQDTQITTRYAHATIVATSAAEIKAFIFLCSLSGASDSSLVQLLTSFWIIHHSVFHSRDSYCMPSSLSLHLNWRYIEIARK